MLPYLCLANITTFNMISPYSPEKNGFGPSPDSLKVFNHFDNFREPNSPNTRSENSRHHEPG